MFPPTPGTSFFDPEPIIPPLEDFLKDSLLLNGLLEEALQDLTRDDDGTHADQLSATLHDGTESFVHSGNILGGHLGTSLQNMNDLTTPHLSSVTSSPSPKPDLDQMLINPLLPPLLPLILGVRSFPGNGTSSPSDTHSEGQHGTRQPSGSNTVTEPANLPSQKSTSVTHKATNSHLFPLESVTSSKTTDDESNSATSSASLGSTASIPGSTGSHQKASVFYYPVSPALPPSDTRPGKEGSPLLSYLSNILDANKTNYASAHSSQDGPLSTESYHSPTATTPEVLKLLANLQDGLEDTPATVQHQTFELEENTIDNFPTVFNKEVDDEGTLLPLWTPTTSADLDWGISEANEEDSMWNDLLYPPYLEDLLDDLNKDDPNIRKIITTLVVSSLFAINPHLSHLIHRYEEALHQDQGIQAPSTTENIIRDAASLDVNGETVSVVNEPLFTRQGTVSTFTGSTSPSPQQSAAIQPSQPPEQPGNDFFTFKPVIVTPASTKPLETYITMQAITPSTAGIGTQPSSAPLSASPEEARLGNCLLKHWCTVGLALTLSLGTTNAMVMPLVMPIMGRRRRKLTFAPAPSSGLHLPSAETRDTGLRLNPETVLSILRRLASRNPGKEAVSSNILRRPPPNDPEGKTVLSALRHLASSGPESKVMLSSILHRLASFDPESYAVLIGGKPAESVHRLARTYASTPKNQ